MSAHACLSCHGHQRPSQFYGASAHVRSLDGLKLAEVRHHAAREVPRHAHDTAFVSVLLAGRYQSRFGGAVVEFEPGRAVWHEDGFDHEDSIAKGGALFFCLEVGRDRLDDLDGQPASDMLGAQASLSLLRLYSTNRAGGDQLLFDALAAEFLGWATRSHKDRPETRSSWLDRVCECLHASAGARASLAELADIGGVHPCHLTRSFRARFGCSIGEYARALRLRHAWQLLADRRTDIAELAYTLGYADQAHFTREFRSVLAMTPASARRSLLH